MTLPTVVPISLTQIQAEFGAPLGTSLAAMVAGGAYVPPGTLNGALVPIPAAPPISVLDFLGASNVLPPTHNMIAGFWDQNQIGLPDSFYYGFSSAYGRTLGSLTPNTLNGSEIASIYTASVFNGSQINFEVDIVGALPQNFWNSIRIVGPGLPAEGVTYTSASAGFTSDSGYTIWFWPSPIYNFQNTAAYDVYFD